MPFVYEQTMTGHVLALLTGIGGLGAGGYHLPMHFLKKSEVCKNTLSYWLMALLTLASVALVIVTISIM